VILSRKPERFNGPCTRSQKEAPPLCKTLVIVFDDEPKAYGGSHALEGHEERGDVILNDSRLSPRIRTAALYSKDRTLPKADANDQRKHNRRTLRTARSPNLNRPADASIRRVIAVSPGDMQFQATGHLTHQDLHFVKLSVILTLDRIIAKNVLTA
jgi:hypothetical protein